MQEFEQREAWLVYSTERCPCHREQLIIEYYPLVRRIAGKMWRKTPPQVDLDDLISYGTLGLIRAVEHYDPERQTSFETYAVNSIRGVILDELRTLDWAPRSLRRKQRELDKATGILAAELGREPSGAELALRVERTEEEVRHTQRATEAAKPWSLDEPDDQEASSRNVVSRYDHMEDRCAPDPLRMSERAVVLAELARLIRSMRGQEQLVIVLYYYERMTLAQVGAVVGVPESRASQIHTEAMMKVRDTLTHVLEDSRRPRVVGA